MIREGGDGDDIPEEAFSLLRKIARQWTGIVNAEELVLKILKGSMTNRVYECPSLKIPASMATWPQNT